MRSETQSGVDGPRQETLTRLVQQYEASLWRLINSYEIDSSRREDLFQDIVLELWKAIAHFRGDSSERTWLYRIAHNTAISALDSRRRRERSEQPMTDTIDYPARNQPADQVLLTQERRSAMLAAIRQLPILDRQVVVLHLEGLSYEEIEHVSGLSQSAIATRLTRIRARLTESVAMKGEHK